MNVESAKKNPLIGALDLKPATSTGKTEGKSEKKSIDLEYAPSTSGSSAAKYFAASTAPTVTSFKGPGVSSQVFGPVTPNPKSMSTKDLAAGIAALHGAMRANVGKVNDQDFELYGAMVQELTSKLAGSVDVTRSPKSMDDRELHSSLLALELQEASGVPLTADQAAFRDQARAEWKERATHDPKKELAQLEARRAKLVHDAQIACGTAVAAGVGLATHNPVISSAASYVAVDHAIHDGHYADAGVEIALWAASFAFGKVPEGIAVAKGALECITATYEVYTLDERIEKHKAALAE